MSISEFRLYFDGTPATEDQLDLFREIRVDQAIGVAAEAELQVDLTLDDQGYWSSIEEAVLQPFVRIRVEVKIGEGEFVPLIEGPVVGQKIEMGAGPGESAMTLIVHDDSVLMNREEKVALFEDMTASDIAESLISDSGLTPEVESVASAGAAYTRYVVQRGTAMQLLRDLARSQGMFVYVKPGESPGQSVCVFAKPSLQPGDAPELLLVGEERNIGKFSATFDGLQPLAASAGNVRISDKSLLQSEAQTPDTDSLGDVATHDVVDAPSTSLVAAAREEQNDLDAATQAAVDLSGFAYTATAELDASDYDHVLSPYQVINVAGPGGYLGGAYLISRVHHVINDGGYKQSLTLKRNARSAGSSGGTSIGGVF
jgi:phage protein D